EFKDLVPSACKSFLKFDTEAIAEGALTIKFKELIAVAVAHTTGCPYCIDIHVKQATDHGSSIEEIGEAIVVATALKAGSALAHGVNALNAYDNNDDDEMYKATYLTRLGEFSRLNNNIFKKFIDFEKQSLGSGLLTVKEKELIAIAVSHTTGCPYCIDVHTK